MNLLGDVADVKADAHSASFIHNDRFRGPSSILVQPLTDIDDGKAERKSYKDRPLLPQNGKYVQIIGRLMKDNTILAVIVYL